jgi:hypothetical protein
LFGETRHLTFNAPQARKSTKSSEAQKKSQLLKSGDSLKTPVPGAKLLSHALLRSSSL